MTKITITDEHVRRFEQAALRRDCTGAWVCVDARAGLEAALSPPPEPDIPVSEGMRIAGRNAVLECCEYYGPLDCFQLSESTHVVAQKAYQAMEKVRREEAKSEPHKRDCYTHRRASDGYEGPERECSRRWAHRREGDQ